MNCCGNCKPENPKTRFDTFMEIAKICYNERKPGMLDHFNTQQEAIGTSYYNDVRAHCESIDNLIKANRLPEALDMIRSLKIILFKAR